MGDGTVKIVVASLIAASDGGCVVFNAPVGTQQEGIQAVGSGEVDTGSRAVSAVVTVLSSVSCSRAEGIMVM